MIQCVSLASGSKGNSFLVQFDDHNYLIDLGISYRQLRLRLQECALTPADIHGVFITHEHSDHIAGLPLFLKYHPVPVFLTPGSARALSGQGIASPLFFISPRNHSFSLADVEITVLPTNHDALEPCAFQFAHRLGNLLHMTDTGTAPDRLCRAINESDLLIIESNHDETMLRNGPYPASLKARIASQFGHLSNRQTFDLLSCYASSRLRHVFLAHLSEHNNTPHLAESNIGRLVDVVDHRFNFSCHLTYPGRLSQRVSIG